MIIHTIHLTPPILRLVSSIIIFHNPQVEKQSSSSFDLPIALVIFSPLDQDETHQRLVCPPLLLASKCGKFFWSPARLSPVVRLSCFPPLLVISTPLPRCHPGFHACTSDCFWLLGPSLAPSAIRGLHCIAFFDACHFWMPLFDRSDLAMNDGLSALCYTRSSGFYGSLPIFPVL